MANGNIRIMINDQWPYRDGDYFYHALTGEQFIHYDDCYSYDTGFILMTMYDDDDDDDGDYNGWNPQRQVRVNPVASTVYCEQGGGL